MSMSSEERDFWIAVHEAGHLTVARAVGFEPRHATIRQGKAFSGCSWIDRPEIPRELFAELEPTSQFVLWPAQIREHIERDVLVDLAGDIAAREMGMGQISTGRTSPTITEVVTESLELTALERSEIKVSSAKSLVRSDAEHVAYHVATVFEPHKNDEPRPWFVADLAAAVQFVEYMAQVCRGLVLRNADRIERLARLLADQGTLSAAAVRNSLDGRS